MGTYDTRYFIVCWALLSIGCGGSSTVDMVKLNGGPLKEVVPVSGVVTVDGEPKEGVDLSLYSMNGGPVLKTAGTAAEGKFCWSSLKACDGVEVGEYRVAFKYVTKANRKGDGDDLLNGRYSASTSTFTLKVEKGQPQNDVKYELTTK